MKHTIWYNGFHGRAKLTFSSTQANGDKSGYVVSRRVARRLNRAVCGCEGCSCGEQVAKPTYDTMQGREDIWVVPTDTELRGNYPQ